MSTKFQAATRLVATTPKSDAVNEIAVIMKKGGLRIARITSHKTFTDLRARGSQDPKDILYAVGFRLTKTGYHGGTVIRRKDILVVLTKEDDGVTSIQVTPLDESEVRRKDTEDANWGASYKGIKFGD